MTRWPARIWAEIAGVVAIIAGVLGLSALRSSWRARQAARETAAAARDLEQAQLRAIEREHQARVQEADRDHDDAARRIEDDLPAAVDAGLARARDRAGRRAR